MSLRKWRTNSQALRDAIPVELRESDPLQVGDSIDGCPKALGIHWQTSSDKLHLHSKLITPLNDKFLHTIQKFGLVFSNKCSTTKNHARTLEEKNWMG